MVWWRIGLGYAVAVIIRLVIQTGIRSSQSAYILRVSAISEVAATSEEPGRCECGHDHSAHGPGGSLGQRVLACVHHAATEFFDMLKYFIVGSWLAAVSQAMIDRQMLKAIGNGPVASVLVMIAFAFVICICSEADAFVAATFASTFTPGALLAFLVAGPMTDIKNTMMMTAALRRPFIIFLNVMIFALTATASVALNLWIARGG